MTLLVDLVIKFMSELEVYRVLTGDEILMIVYAALSPVLGLVMKDVSFFVQWFVAGSPKNTSGMLCKGSAVFLKVRVIGIQSRAVIIPVYRHSKGICNKSSLVGRNHGFA